MTPKTLPYGKPFLDWADVEWSDNDGPLSRHFDDVYYNRTDGLAESRFVFLDSNQLPQRWKDVDVYTIGELGFGTGLNFLATWDAWRQDQGRGWLHYVSFEQSLMSAEDRRRALSRWPELAEYLEELDKKLLLPAVGVHRMIFPEDRITLTLALGDARELLPRMKMAVDSWYFDGFAPAKNPELWGSDLVQNIPSVSAPNAVFASYSVTGDFKRSLRAAGYTFKRLPGFGHKWEMLRGVVPGTASTDRQHPKSVAVIGAGLAGCSVAWSLAKRGIAVDLYDRHSEVAEGASGNAMGIMMPYLARHPDLRTRLAIQGFVYTINLLQQMEDAGHELHWNRCGIVRLGVSKSISALIHESQERGYPSEFLRGISAEEASQLAGIALCEEGLHFPHGCAVSPKHFCRALVADGGESITFHGNTAINDLQQLEHDAIVIASSYDSTRFQESQWLPLIKTRGQVVYTENSPTMENLRVALCYDGYTTPPCNGSSVIGSSFEKESHSTILDQNTQRKIVEKLEAYAPELSVSGEKELLGRVAFRSGTPDRMPLAGRLPNREKFASTYRQIKYRDLVLSGDEDYWDDRLYVSLAHGSHGLQMAPILGELIASQMTGAPCPCDRELHDGLNPLRFVVRELNT